MASPTSVPMIGDIEDIANIYGCLLFLSLMIPELQHPQKALGTVNMDPSVEAPRCATRRQRRMA